MSSHRNAHAASLLAAMVTVVAISFPHSAAAAGACDRACLSGLISQYVDSLVARDPSTLPLAEKARITEDSKAIKLGEGLWKTVTAKGSFRHDYLDTRKQVAASHVVVLEGQTQVLLSVLCST